MKTALIFGIGGMDGSYLAELLLEKGYKVVGVLRYCSNGLNKENIKHLMDKLVIEYGDITDERFVRTVIQSHKPDECYNLAMLSHVQVSFANPYYAMEVGVKGVLNILETIKGTSTKLYQASTSEQYGNQPAPQSEKTAFDPVSPYAIAKLSAHKLVQCYRKQGVFACCGILFNHTSKRRGNEFVEKKIVNYVKHYTTQAEPLRLGTIDSKRDWGHSQDYVKAMWMMLQHPIADDYVIATGLTWSVKELTTLIFEKKGLLLEWKEDNTAWIGEKPVIVIDERLFRPVEVCFLQGDATKAKTLLGWKPEKTLEDIIEDMLFN